METQKGRRTSMTRRQRHGQIPPRVARRILQRAAQGEPAVVVVMRNGLPSRVFGLEDYLRMRDLPKQVKPWEHRTSKSAPPDPLGATDLGVLVSPLTREQMYE